MHRIHWSLAAPALLTSLVGCDNWEAPRADNLVVQSSMAADTPRPGADGHWPGWRGGPLQGVSCDSTAPEHWSDVDGVCWRVPVAGEGHSSPIVWGEQVFLTSSLGADSLSALCFRLSDGQLLWQQVLASQAGPTHRRNGHASATMATNGHVLLARLGDQLFGLDLDGQVLWSCPLGGQRHKWGAASSPVICGDLAIQLCDGEDGSWLKAIDLVSGAVRWQTPRSSDGCWTTPVVAFDGRGRPQSVIVNGTGSKSGEAGEVIAYRADTGRELWSLAGVSDIPCPTALVTDELVISSSGSNGPLLAIDRRAAALGQPQFAWRQSIGGSQVPTGLVLDGRLYLIGDHGLLSCLDAATAQLLWRHRLPGEFSASLIAAGDKIYATSEQGHVYVMRAGEKFELLAKNSLQQTCYATGAVARGRLLFRSESHLWCIGAK